MDCPTAMACPRLERGLEVAGGGAERPAVADRPGVSTFIQGMYV